jgi:NAD(P)-dependent dehydrogenase (short-subunit alcohol dehydrogenase family)
VAQTVVAEIFARGGEAVANTGDVSNQSDAQAMVAAAIDNYGRVDIVINNAGIMTVNDFASLPLEALRRQLEVHVVGAFNVTQQAWPHFVDQQYGRVVMTISTGVFGAAETVHYSSAKAGVIGLTRSLANMTLEAVRDNWDTIYAVKDLAFPASTREALDLRRKWSR